MVRGGIMYCKVCGDENEGYRIFGIYMCKRCFNKLETVSIDDEDYDEYKNLIRILLSYYISKELNPVN
jgi:hypothetical protein